MYTIVEVSTIGKWDETRNEDGWIANPHYVAVIDGSTSKGTLDYGEKKSGRLAMEILREAISTMRPGISIQEAAEYLSTAIATYYAQHQLIPEVTQHPENRLTASAVIYSVDRREVWQLGDCPCMIGGKNFENPKYWEEPLAQARSLYLERELMEGKSVEELLQNDSGRDYILPLLRFSTVYQNNANEPEYAFAVIDGFTIPPHLLKCHSVGNAQELVLASDGYLQLFPMLQHTESYTMNYLLHDPLCIHKHKMTKGLRPNQVSFDDRTYIRLKL